MIDLSQGTFPGESKKGKEVNMNTNFVQDAMHEVENLLKNAFTKAMQDGKLPEAEIPNFTVEIPAETTHGDFASNAAMVSARTFRNAPVKIACRSRL